jgi:hypothetical protein
MFFAENWIPFGVHVLVAASKVGRRSDRSSDLGPIKLISFGRNLWKKYKSEMGN